MMCVANVEQSGKLLGKGICEALYINKENIWQVTLKVKEKLDLEN